MIPPDSDKANSGRLSAGGPSYGQILKSSSIIGGAQGLNYLILMARTKAVAIFLGPAGVGIVGLYTTAISFVATFSALGIQNSAVRRVAEADGLGDEIRLSKTIQTLRRICWLTGFLGWALTAMFAWPLSLWIFGSGERAWALALLGAGIVMSDVSGGQSALLQGKRRISDLARLSIVSALVGSLVSVGLYAWLREAGIIPVMLISGAISLGSSWWFARKVEIADVILSWRETWPEARQIVHLGLAFMWSGVLAAALALVIRSLIARSFGLEANGVYQAAWGISGMFAGFIIGAMGTDFYPRLTAAAKDHAQMCRLVNEQTEIGILLALPGLVATLAFAPLIMRVLYTEKFLPGAELLPWFVLGIFGKVVCWPMGFIMIAKGNSRWFAASETASSLVYLGLTIGLMRLFGFQGSAFSFAGLYILYVIPVYFISRRLIQFRWSPAAVRLLVSSSGLFIVGFATEKWTTGYAEYGIGGILTLTASIFSLRGITNRLGPDHRIVHMACKLPFGRLICGA